MNLTDKQSNLNKFIVELSQDIYDDKTIKQMIDKDLTDIYSKEFRHSYSQIFGTIEKQILDSPECNLEYLSNNFYTLYEVVNCEDSLVDDGIKKSINKLFDHVMLEVARIGYVNNKHSEYNDIDRKLINTNEKVGKILELLLDARSEMDTLRSELTEAKSKMDSLRSESVTVLSILAAIMLAGMGGFTILGKIAEVSINLSNYRFFAITSFLGIILFNVVFMLIYMIARLTGKNVYTICTDKNKGKNSDCIEGSCNNNCGGLNRVRKRLPYVFWFNVIALSIMIASLSIEYIVNVLPVADWLLIMAGILFIELAVYYGLNK